MYLLLLNLLAFTGSNGLINTKNTLGKTCCSWGKKCHRRTLKAQHKEIIWVMRSHPHLSQATAVHFGEQDPGLIISKPRIIIEYFGMEGTVKIISFQLPCHGQGHLPLDQVGQSTIQHGLVKKHVNSVQNSRTLFQRLIL